MEGAPDYAEQRRSTYRKVLKALDQGLFWLDLAQDEAPGSTEAPDAHGAVKRGIFHLGEAGGIAFSGRFAGTDSGALFDDISDALELRDLDRTHEIRNVVQNRSRSAGEPDEGAAVAEDLDWDSGYLQMLAVLNESRQVRDSGDLHRYSVMAGFLSGLMHWDTGRDQHRAGSLRDAVIAAYNDGWGAALWVEWEGIREARMAGGSLDSEEDPDLLLRWVGLRLAAADRMTGPLFFSSDDETDDERSERESDEQASFLRCERSTQRAQNFGKRLASRDDDGIWLPASYALNRALVLDSHKDDDAAGGERET